jgi:hypothetical protein
MANYAICSNADCVRSLDLMLCAVSGSPLCCPRCGSQMYCRCPFCHMPFVVPRRFWRPTECQSCGVDPWEFGAACPADFIPSRRYDVFAGRQPRSNTYDNTGTWGDGMNTGLPNTVNTGYQQATTSSNTPGRFTPR